MSPVAVFLACLAIVVPAMLVILGSMRRLGLLEGTFTSALAELRKSVDELREGLKQITKIPEIERRLGVVEAAVSDVSKRVNSTDKFKAVTTEQIKQFERERSSPDLSRFAPPPIPIPRKP